MNKKKKVKKMQIISILIFSFTCAPPLVPPSITKTTYDENDDWSLEQIDLQTASEKLLEFSKTHLTPDFSCSPLQNTMIPQGVLGMKKDHCIKLVCHFLERKPETFSITSIAVPRNEIEAGGKLLDYIDNCDDLVLDELIQERWKLEYWLRRNK